MPKNKFTNFLLTVLVVITLVTNINLFSIVNNNKEEIKEKENLKQMVNEEIEAENQRKLDEELLRKKIEHSKNFVKSISDQTEIILLIEDGNFAIKHDRTPKNNQLNEWLLNAEMTIKLDYRTIFSIKTKDITFDVTNQGNIIVNYDTSKIVITAIDISNVIPIQKTGIFGTKYKPTEVAALEKIAKEKILKQSYNDDNILAASDNLKSFINDLASKFNVEDITITADNEDIYIRVVKENTDNIGK